MTDLVNIIKTFFLFRITEPFSLSIRRNNECDVILVVFYLLVRICRLKCLILLQFTTNNLETYNYKMYKTETETWYSEYMFI